MFDSMQVVSDNMAERIQDTTHSRVALGSRLKVLIVDDDAINRQLLQAMLRREGHAVVTADDGSEAVRVWERESPDIVLMDVMMPVMDGYEATRKIKELSGESFVPVIFVTALTDNEALVKCIESGGDDFLTKPYNRIILNAKIDALARVKQLYATLKNQKEELIHYHDRLQHEHEVAERVFMKIMGAQGIEVPNMQCLVSPMAITNGDLVLTAESPEGFQRLMIGDFTGHGLAAAMGAIPVSDTFYAMTNKGFEISDIVTELNRKLNAKLPTDVFLAACLVDLDMARGSVRIWNGGIPDVLIVSEGEGEPRRAVSKNLPLGILEEPDSSGECEDFTVEAGDRVYLYSDGVIEASNPSGEVFGQQRLEACIEKNRNRAHLFAEISAELSRFRGEETQSDDITMVELLCDGSTQQEMHRQGTTVMRKGSVQSEPDWRLGLTLGPGAMRSFDPLEMVLSIVSVNEELKEHRTRLYAVLAELYSNALEHGILGLDPTLKATSEGFNEFYSERERALESLTDGRISIDVRCDWYEHGGRIAIEVEDSGAGYEVEPSKAVPDRGLLFGGRGMGLVKSLCESVCHNEIGNRVSVVYAW